MRYQVVVPDTSFWQYGFDEVTRQITRFVDFEKMRSQTSAVIIRAGQNLWRDVAFTTSWPRAKSAGLARGCYWFYDSRANPKRQAEYWVDVLGGDLGELPLFLDLEDNYGGAYGGMRHWHDCLERLKVLVPEKEIWIYTGYWYWLDHTVESMLDYFDQYPLWIAAYKTNAPSLPEPWVDWGLWQFTDEGDGKGFGVASAEIDLNYFNGDQSAFDARFGLDAVYVGNKSLRAYMSDGTQIIFEKKGD